MSKASNRPAWWPTPEQKAHADAGCAHPDECRLESKQSAPSLPVREGDTVRVVGPPEVVGVARVTSSFDKDGTVVLNLQYVAPGLDDAGVSR